MKKIETLYDFFGEGIITSYMIEEDDQHYIMYFPVPKDSKPEDFKVSVNSNPLITGDHLDIKFKIHNFVVVLDFPITKKSVIPFIKENTFVVYIIKKEKEEEIFHVVVD